MSLNMKMAVAAMTVPFVLVGCGKNEAEIKMERETNVTMEALQEKRIDVPEELYNRRTPKGSYEITVNIYGEEKDCIANVTSTHSLGRQVILTNCHTPN